ncbi:hypothetical protein MLD52_11710 [Puniceicoccaceae bacterium K14]|nr:hypothetical protein [Puniceicoccaceae bacterium K14]
MNQSIFYSLLPLRIFCIIAGLISLLSVSLPFLNAKPNDFPSAELLFFTNDGTEGGESQFPGFTHQSIWSGLGKASNGKIYFAASNHEHGNGNSAIYVYKPGEKLLHFIGDVAGASRKTGNWLEGESQFKVHTFMLEHSDGFMYFASMDYAPSPLLRGAHLYRINTETDEIEDFSQNFPNMLDQALNVVPNTGENRVGSGVLVEKHGIRGIGLNPQYPDVIYAMTYPDGNIIKTNIVTGDMQVVGKSSNSNYVFYVDEVGSVYYTSEYEDREVMYKYDNETSKTRQVGQDLPLGEFGCIAPTADGRFVYFLHAKSKRVYRLDTKTEFFEYIATVCGSNWWKIYNMSLSPDEKSLYFVCNNNDRKAVRRIALSSRHCVEFIRIDELLGTRDLCFGGIGIWDDEGSFYSPVWTHSPEKIDLAILKAKVEKPHPKRKRKKK